ncbi:MAG: hypothetical protein EOP53_06955 [Sphingobacteriales bacterium]|nr:MAG: hypothetical protein EOP53_06955 [Sphingobacteriales bacterium]
MKAFFTKAIYVSFFCALLLVSMLSVQSCNVRKRIPPGSQLLSKVKIKGEPTAYSDEVYALLKQKPNKKVIGLFRINMWVYFWANQSAMKRRREKKLVKLQNSLAQSLEALEALPETEDKKRKKLDYKIVKLENKVDKQRDKVANLSRGVFEPPVLLDTFLASSSSSQIQAYLFNKGYFHNTVSSELRYGTNIHRLFYYNLFGLRDNDSSNHKRKTKATIIYNVNHGEPTILNQVEYLVYDSTLFPLVIADSLKSEIKLGKRYDGDALARERERLYLVFRNNGYYNFSREYIYYGLDSAIGKNKVDVYLGISNPPNRTKHRIYTFDKIYIEPEYFLGDSTKKDTFALDDYTFISNGTIVNPSLLADFVFFNKGEIFRLSDYQSTLSRLSQLNLFRYIDVQFTLDTIGRKDTGLLNAHIRLTPMPKMEWNTNLELNYRDEGQTQFNPQTNSRSLGMAGSVSYKNRTLGKSGLQLEIRPRLAVEIPVKTLVEEGINVPSYEAGLGTSLAFPQLLFPKHLLPKRFATKALRLASQTTVNLNFLYEQNKYFNRTTYNNNLTYQITKGRIQHFVTLAEVSLVNTSFNNAAFQKQVEDTRNPLLINLFDQHIITNGRYAFVLGQQPITNVAKRYWFLKESIELGGNTMAAFDKIADTKRDTNKLTKKIFGINYYQYFRNEVDLRFYSPAWRDNNIALRTIVGFGLPYGNSTILPFERRFYVGGANSIRAWRLRELGPGQYKDNNEIAFDKSGDLKLETNAEFRFPVYGLFKSALFVDAGNVWTYKEDVGRPGSKFKTDSFYKQIAVGAGLGLRFDFTFFVLRLDLALPVRDPSLPAGDRMVFHNFNNRTWIGKNINTNLGIGYPF